jgi:hypothetical protein
MSMLPPTRRGGTTLCLPGSAGARPMVPVKGLSGTLAHRPNKAGASVLGSYRQRCSAASLKSSANSPKPGIFAVHPQPDGANDSSVALSTSPGSAPSMKMGPETGLTWAKSIRPTSATVDVRHISGRPRHRPPRIPATCPARCASPAADCCPSPDDFDGWYVGASSLGHLTELSERQSALYGMISYAAIHRP